MKKLLILVCITLSFVSCTKETTVIVVQESQQNDTNTGNDDLDGDGVKNLIEEIDGTDAHDGCKYLPSSQNYGTTSEEWRNSDCDGDGVTNGLELDPDGDGTKGPDDTDPMANCIYNRDDQNYGITTSAYRNLDCDGDGVTNGDEIDPDGDGNANSNGTNPLDECDLVVSQQTLPPSEGWLEGDCDEDCVTNEQELLDATDPLDGEDYLGKGEILKEYREQLIFGPEEIHIFDQDGDRLVEIVDVDGLMLSNFEYSGENLIAAQVRDSNGNLFNVTYEFQGNQLTKINRDGTERTLEYLGNTILSHDSEEPPGLYREKLTFDSANDKLLMKERFYLDGNTWILHLTTYSYHSSSGLITGYFSEIEGYDPATGEFFDVDPFGDYDASASFLFNGAVNNPFYNATQRMKIQILFDPDIINQLNQSTDAVNAHFVSKHLSRFSWGTQNVDYAYSLRIGCTNSNNDPTRGDYLSIYSEDYGDLIYIYE